MWVEFPEPPRRRGEPRRRTAATIGRRNRMRIICTGCSSVTIIYRVPNWEQYGCYVCGTAGTFGLEVGRFTASPPANGERPLNVEDLPNLKFCECNLCDGRLQ